MFARLALTAIAVAGLSQASVTAADANIPQQPTFNKHVAPLIFEHCAACHRPGEVAPFSLLTYRDVQKRARQIQGVTSKRLMPPWKAVAGHGDFQGARRLSENEIALLARWAETGAAEGDPKDLPAQPKFTDGWQLGQPDLIVKLAKPFDVPAEGPDIYRNFVLPIEVPAGKYLRAAEYRPGNRRVVHHAVLAIDPTGAARQRDNGSGFTQFAVPGQLFPGSMAAWVPGREARPLPEGFSMPWRKGADLVLQLHLHPSGKPETEMSAVGLYFTDKPPVRTMLDVVLIDRKIDIPAGEKAYRTRDTLTLPADSEVHAIFPHMHLIGKDVKVTAKLPDGGVKPLLWIDDWDFKWQNYYEYAAPVKLPKGTQLVLECVHDNSAENPANPSMPPKRVTWGEQTNDEMSTAILQIVPQNETDATALAQGLGLRIVGRISAGDKGGTGSVTIAALAAAIKDPPQLIRLLDKDGDGKLSKEELAEIPGAAERAADIIAKFDANKDGKLDANELMEALKAARKR
ncbi:MAG: ascorbate-dependent monooxygenase [Planctomycetia bacterium]|nr:ascorbate-dependent monooxygenase [Planctomycetia bacterium]